MGGGSPRLGQPLPFYPLTWRLDESTTTEGDLGVALWWRLLIWVTMYEVTVAVHCKGPLVVWDVSSVLPPEFNPEKKKEVLCFY